jgi:ATP-dependent DNA helicase DinG
VHRSGHQFIDEVFSSDGPLSAHIKDFELRSEQKAMAHRILTAYEEGSTALIEAGTGIGKSWAYLIPTLFWCVRHGEQAVVSTHTIPLQEQLIEKDIPFLLKVLGVDIKPVLVKGMGNYLCHKRLDDAMRHGTDGSQNDRDLLLKIEDYAARHEVVCN